MERCHPREKPLIGKWEASNGDGANSVLMTGELRGCPRPLAPTQQATTFGPQHGGFPPGPTVSQVSSYLNSGRGVK